MTRDWPALADAIKSHRNGLKMTQQQLAAEAETSTSTVQKLESGRGGDHWKDLPDSLPRVERALRWEPGAAEEILDGEPAPPLPEGAARRAPRRAPAEGAPDLPEGLPLRAKRELTSGRVVEATVVEASGGSRFVVVWTAGDDVDLDALTPEALEQWTRLNRAALGLPTGSDNKNDS